MLPTAIGRMPPSFFLWAVRLAEDNWIQTKSLIFRLRKIEKIEKISSFCCLVGDVILEVDGSETINTASAAARERTNFILNILIGCCHRRDVCGNRGVRQSGWI